MPLLPSSPPDIILHAALDIMLAMQHHTLTTNQTDISSTGMATFTTGTSATATTTTTTEDSLQMLFIPLGLLLLFFGSFIFQPTIIISYILMLTTSKSIPTSILYQTLIMIIFLCCWLQYYQFAMSYNKNIIIGFLTGILISFSWHSNSNSFILLSFILSSFFALLYAIIPKEISIFLTSYVGAFLMFYGLALIDTCNNVYQTGCSLITLNQAFSFQFSPSVDLWFSVLSFLIVGVLGCGVQIMLMSSQEERSSSRPQYIAIP